MSVSHARATAVTSTDGHPAGEVPGLLEVLAQVPDPRRFRGRRYLLAFVLAVAAACVLAGAKSFREIGDHAADLPQEILARLGGKPHPLLRRIIAPSEKRIRTLVHAIGAEKLDELTGGWLRALADAGRLEGLLTAIAIDGKWLRGVADGQVKLFAAILQEEKAVIAQHRIPDETTETTQVKELLDPREPRSRDTSGTVPHIAPGTQGVMEKAKPPREYPLRPWFVTHDSRLSGSCPARTPAPPSCSPAPTSAWAVAGRIPVPAGRDRAVPGTVR